MFQCVQNMRPYSTACVSVYKIQSNLWQLVAIVSQVRHILLLLQYISIYEFSLSICVWKYYSFLGICVCVFLSHSQIHVSLLEPEIAAMTDCEVMTYNKGL